MPENLEARLLEAFIALVGSVLVQDRSGYYETNVHLRRTRFKGHLDHV